MATVESELGHDLYHSCHRDVWDAGPYSSGAV
jgi:hypothetical protein